MSDMGREEYVHMIDQLFAYLSDSSKAIAQYYKTLIDEGVPEDKALYLTVEMQKNMWPGHSGSDESEGWQE